MTESSQSDATTVREAVRTHYATQARRILSQAAPEPGITPSRADSCCAPATRGREAARPDLLPLDLISPPRLSSCRDANGCATGDARRDPISSDLYSREQVEQVPTTAIQASLGCGNPTALIDLRAGEVVLDLGSGGGIDVILSARRVGPTGRAYGVDMTDEMLTLARRNAAEAGLANVEFLKGQIEAVPLPDASVDVVISNCVINLAADKGAVLREAYRILRPGGRFAVADVVVEGLVPPVVQERLDLWAGCIAGALQRNEYEHLLRESGFTDLEFTPLSYYTIDDLGDPDLSQWFDDQPLPERERLSRAFYSAFIRARKRDPA